jgi:hypothetical protein
LTILFLQQLEEKHKNCVFYPQPRRRQNSAARTTCFGMSGTAKGGSLEMLMNRVYRFNNRFLITQILHSSNNCKFPALVQLSHCILIFRLSHGVLMGSSLRSTMTLYMAQQGIFRRTHFGAYMANEFGHTNAVCQFVFVQTFLIFQRFLTNFALWSFGVDGVHVVGVVYSEIIAFFKSTLTQVIDKLIYLL